MQARVALALAPAIAPAWEREIARAAAAAGLEIELSRAPLEAPETVDYLVFGLGGPVADLRPFTRLKAILNIWAGVEKVLRLPAPPHDPPLCRMVEPGLVWGMTDYVVAHATRYHIDLDATLAGDVGGWGERAPPLARDRRVGVLGLGALGADAARALAALRFDVAGWSRTPKRIPGLRCRAGAGGLAATLAHAEILICLLPATPATEGLLDAAALARLPRGARLINAGRGELIDDAALLAALDAGHVAHATLDVFREEPLPADHPYRRHPRVTVTPHVASATRPETAAPELVAQIARGEAGRPFAHVVDRARGY